MASRGVWQGQAGLMAALALPARTTAPAEMVGAWHTGAVYNVDALTLLAGLPSGSVDAIITDPPYQLTELDFDQASFDWRSFWLEAKRVLARPSSPVVLFSQQPFTTDLIISNRKWFRFEIIYEKTMPTGYLNANRTPLRAHENILVFSAAAPDYYPVFEQTTDIKATARKRTGAAHYNEHAGKDYHDTGRRYPRSVWRFAQRHTAFKQTETLHPTEKPLSLMERLVETFTRPEDLIVDCFAGSGSTGSAAVKTLRRFVGGDTNNHCCEIARARLAAPYTLPMFAEAGL